MLWLSLIILLPAIPLGGFAYKRLLLHGRAASNLEIDYPQKEYPYNARRVLKKKMIEFDKAFYFNDPKVKKDQFHSIMYNYPRNHSNQETLQNRLQLYRTMNLEKQALALIEKALPIELTLKNQITYFKNELMKIQQTKKRILQHEFYSFFPKLYSKRVNLLDTFAHNYQLILEKLEDEFRSFEEAITELSRMKKKNLLQKAGQFTMNVITAPARHVLGILNKDTPTDKDAATIIVELADVTIAIDKIEGIKIEDPFADRFDSDKPFKLKEYE